MTRAPSHTREQAVRRRGSATEWYALFGGPVSWFAGLCIGYFIVTPACRAGSELPVHIVSAVTLALALGALAAGRLIWRSTSRAAVSGTVTNGAGEHAEGGLRTDRTRFIATVGMALSALFTLVILAQWFAAIMHGPCAPLPRLPDAPDAFVERPPDFRTPV